MQLAQAGVEAQPTTVAPSGLIIEKQGAVADFRSFSKEPFTWKTRPRNWYRRCLILSPANGFWMRAPRPEGKTTHLAALMNNCGEIIAWDRSAARLRLLKDNCRRLGISIVQPIQMDAEQAEKKAARSKPFDRILVDAPCSGFGVLRRHPEAKWCKHENLLLQQQARQLSILTNVHHLFCDRAGSSSIVPAQRKSRTSRVVSDLLGPPRVFTRTRHALVARFRSQSRECRWEFSTMLSPHSMDRFFAARLRKAV